MNGVHTPDCSARIYVAEVLLNYFRGVHLIFQRFSRLASRIYCEVLQFQSEVLVKNLHQMPMFQLL